MTHDLWRVVSWNSGHHIVNSNKQIIASGENVGRLKQIVTEHNALLGCDPKALTEALKSMVYQFADYGVYDGRLCINTMGLSALEEAFDALGWDYPHPVPWAECEVIGCHEHAVSGGPTPSDGYHRACRNHDQKDPKLTGKWEERKS